MCWFGASKLLMNRSLVILSHRGCVIRACELLTMLFGLKEVLGSLCFVNRFLS